MARIHFLGTCSGTEPMPDTHHCSLVLECAGRNYWFDAGECCAHTAYLSGIDPTKTEALFVSHPHIDHIGGLANLFHCMSKLIVRNGASLPNGNTLEVFFPDYGIFDAIKKVAAMGGSKLSFNVNENPMRDGVIFDDGILRVTACHNRHLKSDDGSNGWRSFSFLLETDGKRAVFSGDVARPDELDALIGDGVDLLIMETGHHSVSDVCEYAAEGNVKRLRFNHHGREILGNRAGAEAFVSEFARAHGFSIVICHDGMTEEL